MGFWRVISKIFLTTTTTTTTTVFVVVFVFVFVFAFVLFFLSDLLLGRGLGGVWEGLVGGYFD